MNSSQAGLRVPVLLGRICAVLRGHSAYISGEELADIRYKLAQAIGSADTRVILGLLERTRQLCGGMGSFNDLFVTDQAGHDIKPKDIDRVNSRLQRLQGSCMSL